MDLTSLPSLAAFQLQILASNRFSEDKAKFAWRREACTKKDLKEKFWSEKKQGSGSWTGIRLDNGPSVPFTG